MPIVTKATINNGITNFRKALNSADAVIMTLLNVTGAQSPSIMPRTIPAISFPAKPI